MRRVDRVAQIMAGTIFDEGDERASRLISRSNSIQDVANQFDYSQIRAFTVAAKIVLVPWTSAFKQCREAVRMIFDEEPVSDIRARTVDGQWLALRAHSR